MKRIRRWWCARHGHGGSGSETQTVRVRMYSLPEEIYGLYAFSRLECMRCGATIAENPNPKPMDWTPATDEDPS